MNSHRAVGLALVTVLAACTTSAEPPSTTTSPSTTAVVDTVPEPTTTAPTAEDEPVDICPRGLVWEVDVSYRAECFFAPVTFRPNADGWRSYGVSSVVVRAERRNTDRQPEVGVQLLAYKPELDPDPVLASILDIDGVEATSPVRTTSLGQRNAVTVDVRTNPDPSRLNTDLGECSQDELALQWPFDASRGYPLVLGSRGVGTWEYGLGACHRFRIWAVDLGDVTITVIAIVFDGEAFDQLIRTAEDLLAAATFD